MLMKAWNIYQKEVFLLCFGGFFCKVKSHGKVFNFIKEQRKRKIFEEKKESLEECPV